MESVLPGPGPAEIVPQAAARVKKEPANIPHHVTAVMEEITEAAMMSRLNRLFKQRSNGTYKVPEEIVQKWKTSDGKDEIIREFRKQGYDKDCIAAKVIRSYNCARFQPYTSITC